MRTRRLSTIGTLDYPAEVAFAFNPLLVVLHIGTVAENVYFMNATLSCGDFTEEREAGTEEDGNVYFDLAPYVRSQFDASNITSPEERVKRIEATFTGKYYVQYTDGTLEYNTDTFTFALYAVWGAILPEEEYNAITSLRRFTAFPQTVEFYAPAGTEVTGLGRTEANGIVSLDPAAYFSGSERRNVISIDPATGVFDNTFDFTFGGISSPWTLTLVNDDTACGVFLRWVDKHGFLRYFLFAQAQETESASAYGDDLVQRYSALGRYYGSIIREQGKTVTRKLKLAALSLSDEEYSYVCSVMYSPVVDRFLGYDDDGSQVWMPVTVKAKDTSRERLPNRQDMEIELDYTVDTQTL